VMSAAAPENAVPLLPLPPAQELGEVFSFLAPPEIETLLPYFSLREWPAEHVIMRDGEPGDFMGFLLTGKLAVKKEAAFRGRYVLMALIEPGGMVGEIAVVEENGQRKATVVTVEKSRVLLLTVEAMERLLLEQNDLAVKLLKRIIHVLGSRLRKASERLSRIL